MRKFAFVIFDESDNIIDRFNLDVTTNLGGLGFGLNVATISTEIEDYISQIIQQKRDITLTIIHNGYAQYENLVSWLLSHINDTLCLEYDNGRGLKYCEGLVVNSGYSEKNVYKVLENSITFRPLTPFFKVITGKIRIQISSKGKQYPMRYPYSYGLNRIENNEVNNIYFKDVPLIITIYGRCTNPRVLLTDELDNIYNEVRFQDTIVEEGQKIVINAAQKKVWKIDANGNKEDFYFKVNGAFDSYLRAEPNKISKININFEPTDTGYLIGSWRQYSL